MIRKLLILASLFFFIDKNTFAFTSTLLGYETCVSADKISHHPGQRWQVSDPNWTVSEEMPSSSLSQFPTDTPVQRTVSPWHITSNLADVTCTYQSTSRRLHILVLTRTYTRGKNTKFPAANYIFADSNSNINKLNGSEAFIWNGKTECSTTLSLLNKCNWGFYILKERDPY